MIKPFEFYFDFISPYSFLAHKEIRKIENKEGIKIKYNPILLGGLHNLHGIKAPAFIPAKARHMIRDCKLIAERNDVKFKFNSYFPIRSLNLMRGVLVAEEDNIKSYYIDVIFNKENLNETLGEVLEAHGKTQLRIAETEKYPHVTFFFSGGRETPFKGEERILKNVQLAI